MSGKKFRMPSAYVVLFSIIVIMAVVTWFVPSGEYKKDDADNYITGSYEQVEQTPQGIWDMLMAPVYGMLGRGSTSGAIEVALFILIIGGFLGVIDRTGAINSGISSLITHNRGKEKKLIFLLMLLFSLGGTTYGMYEETIVFYPLVIPIILAAGFDTITAVAVVLLGAGVGVLGSTVNPFATGVASQSLGLSVGDGIGWRLLILASSVLVTIWYVYAYALKVQKNPEKSLVASTLQEDKKHFAIPTGIETVNSKQKVVLVLFMLTFVVMIASLIPWSAIIPNFTFFEDNLAWLQNLPVLGVLLGKDALPLGDWYFAEISMLFLTMSVIIGLLYKLKEDTIIDGFLTGASGLLGVAFVVAVARGIQVIMNEGQITSTFLYWCEGMLSKMPKGLFSVFAFIIYIPLSFLIPSTSGLASATMAIVGPMADFVGVQKHVVVTAFQSASGIVNIVTPTSGVVMGALAIARVPFDKWLLFCGKLLGILFVLNAAIIWLAAVIS